MFIDRKTQYVQDVSSSQLNLSSQNNLNKNLSKLFCGYWQIDSKVYKIANTILKKNKIGGVAPQTYLI